MEESLKMLNEKASYNRIEYIKHNTIYMEFKMQINSTDA